MNRRTGVSRWFRPRPPRPREVWHGLRLGVGWVQDQLEPLLAPFRLHAARRQPGAGEPGTQATARDDGWGVLERVTFARFLDWPSEREPSLSIDVDRALWTFEEDDDGHFEQWDKTIFVPPAGHAARIGDVMLHGDRVAPGPGSPNVLIGGQPALRSCDSHVCTQAVPMPHAGTGFVATYTKVEINGFPALRVGDYVDEGPHGLNTIAVGCPSVVIGPTPRPVECWRTDDATPVRQPEDHAFDWRRDELGPHERKEVLGLELDGPRARAQGKAKAVWLWAEVEHEDERR